MDGPDPEHVEPGLVQVKGDGDITLREWLSLVQLGTGGLDSGTGAVRSLGTCGTIGGGLEGVLDGGEPEAGLADVQVRVGWLQGVLVGLGQQQGAALDRNQHLLQLTARVDLFGLSETAGVDTDGDISDHTVGVGVDLEDDGVPVLRSTVLVGVLQQDQADTEQNLF